LEKSNPQTETYKKQANQSGQTEANHK